MMPIQVPDFALVRPPEIIRAGLSIEARISGYKSLAADVIGQMSEVPSALAGLANQIGLAAAASGPAAPFIAAAGGLLGVFKSFFGGSAPPPPLAKIGGEDANEVFDNPFRDASRAIAVGHIVSGGAKVPVSFPDVVKTGIRNTVRALRTARGDFAKASAELPHRVSMAAFCAAAMDYDDVFPMLPDESYAAELGKMLGWAAPRLRVLKMLTYVHYALTTASVEQSELTRKAVQPRGLAKSYEKDGALPSTDWKLRALALAFPIPRRVRKGVWIYEPWPVDIANAYLGGLEKAKAKWHDWGPVGRREIAFPGTLFVAPPFLRKTTKLTITQAANVPFALWAREKSGDSANYMTDFRQTLHAMQTERGGVASPVAAPLKARELEVQKRLVVAKKAARMLNARLAERAA